MTRLRQIQMKTTFGVFLCLAFLALISLLLGTNSPRYTVAAQFVFLGIAFDALRVFCNRALNLLDSATALLVNAECKRYIKRTRRAIERVVRIYQRGGLTPDGDAATVSRWLIVPTSRPRARSPAG
jgi:hypothetical protein